MQRIYIWGLPGAGKSTLGKALAAHLSWAFIDLDHSIESKYGKITDLFKEKGEEAFRVLEREVLIQTIFLEKTVVACGGGTPCFFNNAEWMTWNGITVYLERNTRAIFDKIKAQPALRPMFLGLSEPEMLSKLEDLRMKRANFYLKSKIIFNSNQHFLSSLSSDIQRITEKIEEINPQVLITSE